MGLVDKNNHKNNKVRVHSMFLLPVWIIQIKLFPQEDRNIKCQQCKSFTKNNKLKIMTKLEAIIEECCKYRGSKWAVLYFSAYTALKTVSIAETVYVVLSGERRLPLRAPAATGEALPGDRIAPAAPFASPTTGEKKEAPHAANRRRGQVLRVLMSI